MSDYNDELMRYQDDAEDRFDDYDPEMDGYDDPEEQDAYEEELEDEYDEYDEYEDLEDDYDDYSMYEEDGYDNFMSRSYGNIDPNDRTLTIVVRNNSDTAAEAIIFGGNQDALQPREVTVDIEESSHKEVREESKSNPFRISGMKYSVSDPLQFDNVLQIVRRTASGSKTTRSYQPRNATSPQNFTQSLIDDDNFQMDVTGQDSIRVMVNSKVTAVFTFTVKARTNIGNLLHGRNIAEISRAPRTTGLPQIDLKRRKTPSASNMLQRRRVRRLQRRPYRLVYRKPSSRRTTISRIPKKRAVR